MPIMLESVSGNLGDAMKYVTSQYCYFLNQNQGWDGQVFRGKYKNKPVYLEQHWIYLLAYLHLNPVRAKLVSDPQEAIWTSHRAYLGKRVDLDWLTHGAGMSNVDAGRTLKMNSNAVCKVPKTLRDNPQAYGG